MRDPGLRWLPEGTALAYWLFSGLSAAVVGGLVYAWLKANDPLRSGL